MSIVPPVSYTHLDVYKRQQADLPVTQACQILRHSALYRFVQVPIFQVSFE